MRSWFVTGTKGFESLEVKEVPIPELGEKDVLVNCSFDANRAHSNKATNTLHQSTVPL